MSPKKVIVICGQTASGKSDLAVNIALYLKSEKVLAEIISADSRQVFSGGDLISAKITNDEMHGIPHHMISIVDIQKDYSVAEYKNSAIKIINELHSKNILPIICGGTGLYIDNLVFNKTIPEVLPNWDLRKDLETKSIEELYEILKTKDPARAENIDPKNKRRLIRALEVINELGSVPSQNDISLIYNTLFIGLYTDAETLKNRIESRTQKRIDLGMQNEIVKYIEKYNVNKEKLISLGLEYKWLTMLYTGEIDTDTCINNINKDSIAYAKRQMTWFKKNKCVNWINTSDIKIAEVKAMELVNEFMEK